MKPSQKKAELKDREGQNPEEIGVSSGSSQGSISQLGELVHPFCFPQLSFAT